jgi:hypothetical protein
MAMPYVSVVRTVLAVVWVDGRSCVTETKSTGSMCCKLSSPERSKEGTMACGMDTLVIKNAFKTHVLVVPLSVGGSYVFWGGSSRTRK